MNEAISDEDRIALNKSRPLKTTLLYAHGKEHKKFKWCFTDNERTKSVLKWIREGDGKFDLIILIVCNPKCKIKTKKSLLIMPDKEFSFWRLDRGWVRINLIKPDNS